MSRRRLHELYRPEGMPAVGAKLQAGRHAPSSVEAYESCAFGLRLKSCRWTNSLAQFWRQAAIISKVTLGGTPQYIQSPGIRLQKGLEEIEVK